MPIAEGRLFQRNPPVADIDEILDTSRTMGGGQIDAVDPKRVRCRVPYAVGGLSRIPVLARTEQPRHAYRRQPRQALRSWRPILHIWTSAMDAERLDGFAFRGAHLRYVG